jgi:hypothetical protein
MRSTGRARPPPRSTGWIHWVVPGSRFDPLGPPGSRLGPLGLCPAPASICWAVPGSRLDPRSIGGFTITRVHGEGRDGPGLPRAAARRLSERAHPRGRRTTALAAWHTREGGGTGRRRGVRRASRCAARARAARRVPREPRNRSARVAGRRGSRVATEPSSGGAPGRTPHNRPDGMAHPGGSWHTSSTGCATPERMCDPGKGRGGDGAREGSGGREHTTSEGSDGAKATAVASRRPRPTSGTTCRYPARQVCERQPAHPPERATRRRPGVRRSLRVWDQAGRGVRRSGGCARSGHWRRCPIRNRPTRFTTRASCPSGRVMVP